MGDMGSSHSPKIYERGIAPRNTKYTKYVELQCCVHAYAHDDCVTIGGKVVRFYDFSVQACSDPRTCDSLD